VSVFDDLSRRQFLSLSGAAAAATVVTPHPLAQIFDQPADTLPHHRIPAPIDIPKGPQPLFKGHTARPLRYMPIDRDFVIENGGEFFNRPLYGRNNDFRVDVGDRPEFSLYLPGHGGNLKLGFITSAGARWAMDGDKVTARYRPGRMIYEIRDPLLSQGTMRLEVLTADAGLLVKAELKGVPPGTRLTWAFAGADGRKGGRNGDIGCESVPVSRYFEVHPEDCVSNLYTRESLKSSATGSRPARRLHSPSGNLLLSFPEGSSLDVRPFSAWAKPPVGAEAGDAAAPHLPILTGHVEVKDTPYYLGVWRSNPGDDDPSVEPSIEFDERSKHLASLADTLRADTPDPYIDAAAAAFGPPADFLWHEQAGCVMHGDVAWRARLAGWRGPYHLDALGNHERARKEFRHWIAMQNTSPVQTADPAIGPPDPNTRLARKEGMLHSNGDLSKNHYDMNMVFFDVLLRHLRWTGDLEFAREVWPAIERQCAWERRLFRRTYKSKTGADLPLYEAYAAIWASDNLQYSGGGTTHSSAYNVFLFSTAALLARLLQKNPEPYEKEARLLHEGMDELLWLADQGAFAESKDLYEPQTAYNNPALWTVYHTIDSEVPTPRQAWQMAAERIAVLGRIPVHGEGGPAGNFYMLSCSNWMPYLWSLNLIVLAENTHMALALWQAGMADEAFALFKGNLLDSMFMGLCPGDFHMTSALDPHRQEAQRDFGDPIGITSRAYVEGLFGVQPNLIANQIRLRPGLPREWNRASLTHNDFDFVFHREGMTEIWEFTSRFPRTVPVALIIPALTTRLPSVTDQGASVTCSFDAEAVGRPMLTISLEPKQKYKVSVQWSGSHPRTAPDTERYHPGERLRLPSNVSLQQVDDPQRVLASGRTAATGFHTVFARIHEGDCTWSMPISFQVAAAPVFALVPQLMPKAKTEPVDLSGLLQHRISEIFDRPYAEPRSPFCSLSIPDTLLGGWSSLGKPVKVDDTGLRHAGGFLHTAVGVPFQTPAEQAPNSLFLSWFKPHADSVTVPLTGRAAGIYLLLTGTTHPQCSRVQHGLVTVSYSDGMKSRLVLRNPENWWPIEQDYMIDDYMFSNDAPLPPRVDLKTGETRILNPVTFKGKGREVDGGAATILHLALDPSKTLSNLRLEVSLYPVVMALLSATLVREV